MSLITISVILILILLIIKLCKPSSKLWHHGNKIPGPKTYPVIGNVLNLITKSRTLLELMGDFNDSYGPIFRLWLGKELFIVITDPDDMEAILSSRNLTKSDSYRFLDTWLGNTNLLTANGDIWHAHRKILTPSFHFKILENSVNMILRNVEILCEKLEQCVDQSEFKIESYIEKFSLDVICETAMGVKLQTQEDDDPIYLKCIKNVCMSIARRHFLPWLHPEPLFKIFKEGRIYFKYLGMLKNEGKKIISERKKLLEESSDALLQVEREAKKQLRPFLDFLLTESNFTDEEIENEVHTFMFAGHDTTKSAISFCLYETAKHPDIQEKIVQETKEVLSDKKELTYQDLPKLKYLDCVIKESMRIYTPVPLFARKLTEDVKVPSGYVLPAGAAVNFNIFYTHRNEKYFPDSLKFLPERFAERDTIRNPFTYIPFSAGPRNCVGQKFAMLEMKLAISMLLLKFEFLPATKEEPFVLENGAVLCSLNGLQLRVKRRNVENN